MGSSSSSYGGSSLSLDQIDQLLSSVNRGDILSFNRGSIYHVALYLGDRMVMDIYARHGKNSTMARICKRLLEDVIGSSSSFQVCNMEHKALSKYNLSPLPVSEIIANAERDEQRGNVEYHYLRHNCEHYATRWRYGTGFSHQADNPLCNTSGGRTVAVVGGVFGLGGLILWYTKDDATSSGKRKRPENSDNGNYEPPLRRARFDALV